MVSFKSKEERQMEQDLREAGQPVAETSMTRVALQTTGKIVKQGAKAIVSPGKSKKTKGTWKPQRPTRFDSDYSKEQKLLGDMFGGNRLMTGGDFKKPHLQGLLREGGGIMKNGDRGQTGRMFGIR